MAITGLVLVAIEVILVLPRALRLTKQLRELNLLLEDNVRLAHDELQILHQARSKTRVLLRPYRRLAKWLTHPIVVALIASLRRRAARRRSASRAQ